MTCAQPQAEAVSLVTKASLLLKIYIRPVVAEIFLLLIVEVVFILVFQKIWLGPLSLSFKFG